MRFKRVSAKPTGKMQKHKQHIWGHDVETNPGFRQRSARCIRIQSDHRKSQWTGPEKLMSACSQQRLYCGWLQNPFHTTLKPWEPVFVGISRRKTTFQSFLGGAGFCPSTVWFTFLGSWLVHFHSNHTQVVAKNQRKPKQNGFYASTNKGSTCTYRPPRTLVAGKFRGAPLVFGRKSTPPPGALHQPGAEVPPVRGLAVSAVPRHAEGGRLRSIRVTSVRNRRVASPSGCPTSSKKRGTHYFNQPTTGTW